MSEDVNLHPSEADGLLIRYPWLTNSTGAGLLAANVSGTPVQVSNLQLWDGLGEKGFHRVAVARC